MIILVKSTRIDMDKIVAYNPVNDNSGNARFVTTTGKSFKVYAGPNGRDDAVVMCQKILNLEREDTKKEFKQI